MLELGDVLHENVERIDSVSRQKTAVAREVARRPKILLFDEPLTNVDSASKYRFQRAFKTLTRATSQTIVYVTHDQTEAMTLADRDCAHGKGKDHPGRLASESVQHDPRTPLPAGFWAIRA